MSPELPAVLRAAVERAARTDEAYGRTFQRLIEQNMGRYELLRIAEEVTAAKVVAEALLSDWRSGRATAERAAQAFEHPADLAARVEATSRGKQA